MGIHNAAMPFAALDLGPPSLCRDRRLLRTEARDVSPLVAAQARVPRPRRHGPITLYWYDGGQKPSPGLVGGRKLADNGAIVVGSKGTLSSTEWTGGDWVLLPESRFHDIKSPSPSVPRAPGQSHHQEWLHACRGGLPAFCRFDGFAADSLKPCSSPTSRFEPASRSTGMRRQHRPAAAPKPHHSSSEPIVSAGKEATRRSSNQETPQDGREGKGRDHRLTVRGRHSRGLVSDHA